MRTDYASDTLSLSSAANRCRTASLHASIGECTILAMFDQIANSLPTHAQNFL